MSEPEKSSVEERIRALRARFAAALPQFVIDTRGRWQRLRDNPWDAQLAKELQNFSHKLSGSGASFGFPEVSVCARPLDEALVQFVVSGASPDKAQLADLDQKLQVMLRAMQLAADGKTSAPEAVEPVEKAAKPGQLVLVIDDDELLRSRLAIVLEEAGYRVVTTGDPEAATALLEREFPAVVLLDLMFPGRGRPAFEVVQNIRDITGQRTPVAIISGRTDVASRLEGVRAGADAYLAKPLDQQQVAKTVAQLASLEQTRLRCLVVDDDTLLAAQLVTWLGADGMVADTVNDPLKCWQKVQDFHPDVLVMDVNMPDCNGIELATLLRQDEKTAFTPIIFLTADTAPTTHQDAMAAGADDFLRKPVRQEVLLQSVRARARLAQRMKEQVRRVTQQVSNSSSLSRHFFFAELERALEMADEGKQHMAFVLMGLTDAPQILKDHGTPGLAEVHEQWVARVEGVHPAKWSMLGENTVGLLLPAAAVAAQTALVRRIVAKLSAKHYRVGTSQVAASMGVAAVHLGRSQATVNTLLMQAEQLLGMAFAAGPGTIKEGFAGVRGTEAADSSGDFPADKMRAVYQPIVTIDGMGSPVNVVLARIADKDGNLLPTGRFLPVLERRGWLPELDVWVFRHAHAMLTQQISSETPLFLVVHASEQGLSSAAYPATVRALLKEQPMRNANQCIVIAVDEAAAISHRDAVAQLSRIVQEAGCGIMLANYGSTTGSLAVLEHVQPLFVRLNDPLARRLEQSPTTDAADKVLLDAVLSANASVVAGGIENARSLSALWSKGVRRFQGYFIQEPNAAIGTDGR